MRSPIALVGLVDPKVGMQKQHPRQRRQHQSDQAHDAQICVRRLDVLLAQVLLVAPYGIQTAEAQGQAAAGQTSVQLGVCVSSELLSQVGAAHQADESDGHEQRVEGEGQPEPNAGGSGGGVAAADESKGGKARQDISVRGR